MEDKSKNEYFCDGCGDLLDEQRDLRYRCPTCPDLDVCKDCYQNEEVSHPHPLVLVKPKLKAKLLFSLKDPKKKGTLYLSNFPVALPGSPYLKQLNIKGVLSVIQFDPKDDTSKMMLVFNGGKLTEASEAKKKSTLVINKILYHHIDIPDLQGPDLLHQYNEFLFEEATSFLDECLKIGNVIVHCKEGQKRSPTIFLAWMVTRGYSVEDAISAIGDGYQDPNFDWREKYEKTRLGWISKLQDWSNTWKKDQADWRRGNKDKIERWQHLIYHGVIGDGPAGRRIVASSTTKAQSQQQARGGEKKSVSEKVTDGERRRVSAVRVQKENFSKVVSASPAQSLQDKRKALAQRQRIAGADDMKESDEEEEEEKDKEEEEEEEEEEETEPVKKKSDDVEGEVNKKRKREEDAAKEEATKEVEDDGQEPSRKKERIQQEEDKENQGLNNTSSEDSAGLQKNDAAAKVEEPTQKKKTTPSGLGIVDVSKPAKANTLLNYFGASKAK